MFKKLFYSSVLIGGLVTMPLTTFADNNVTTQHGDSLVKYNQKKYKVVNNANQFVKKTSYVGSPGYYDNVFQTNVETIHSTNQNNSFTTEFYLPVSYNNSGDLGNPQSLVIISDYAYVMYTMHGGSNWGFVVRYDLKKMRQLHLNMNTTMDQLRRASFDHMQKNLVNFDSFILQCIKVGPKFYTGHGQSLAYDSKSNRFWFVLKNGLHPSLEQMNFDTLLPEHKINFKLNRYIPMGENLVFDNQGRAYFYTYNQSKFAPKGSVKLYQGIVSNHKIKFHLIMQGIRHAPGTLPQSLGYDWKTNQLYIVADDSIMRLPVNKLGHLKPKDVVTSNYNSRREFEGLAFDDNGDGYLLLNRGPEILKLNGHL